MKKRNQESLSQAMFEIANHIGLNLHPALKGNLGSSDFHRYGGKPVDRNALVFRTQHKGG